MSYLSTARKRGFTLIELLVAIAIIGVILAVALPNYVSVVEGAKLERIKSDMEMIKKAVRKYVMRLGVYPKDLKYLKGSFLSRIPKTPFNTDYKIRSKVVTDERGISGKFTKFTVKLLRER